MRFIFDRQTGHKKKLNTFISFPEQLDMGPFLEDKQDQKCIYELSAVLIHRGISAYSGHYIAHVKDALTGDWYKFNDEEIEKMEGKKLQLGVEEDIGDTVKSQSRKPKCSKGYHCSRNAYMLVYKIQGEETSDPTRTKVEVPSFLQRLVDQDNRKFEEWCTEMADMRKQSVDKGKAKHEEVKELYTLLSAEDGEQYDFIPMDWLKKWLDDSTVSKEINNSPFLCSHGKLHPDKVGEVKRISFQAANVLYERYGGGPRLNGSSLCRECVSQQCRVLRLKNQLSEDFKEVSNLVKRSISGEGYWVGKASLRSWRQLALVQLEEDEHETKPSNSQTNGQGLHTNNKDFASDLSEGLEDEMKTFNEDIVCCHGGLSILELERKLVSTEVWTKLRKYFPKSPEFSQNQELCQQCLTLEQEEKDNEAISKMMALDQKNQLLNLFHEKNRPTLTKWPQGTEVLYIVPVFFVDEWKKFIRRPTKSSPVSNVGNTLLLCPHGGFMFTYESLINGEAQHVALLWPDEWEVISRLFIVDHSISIHCLKQSKSNGGSTQFTTQPELCWECRESFLFQQQRDLREYTQATIYIRKILQDKGMKDAAPELNASSSEAEEDREELPRVDGETDPDFSQSQDNAKRLKLSDGAALFVTNVTKPGGIRRSTRHRKLRGEKALIVSANQTLKELKIQIMHAFSVAPFDQNLSINGKGLTDDSATLGSLGVIPESIICLKADEPIADYAVMDDAYQVRMPEEGFKGTGLLGH
uniref:Ubiquitin carboxyl-terminal hydrolase 48 n=1 Tax=Iconisemion striatum TaxID=60296 RepID=A0A1A7YAH0_9TELE